MLLRRLATPVVTTGALLGASLLWVAPAQAALPTGCSQVSQTVTCTFSYTGAPVTWTVPDGVTSATFEAWGAAGADADFRTEVPGPDVLGGLGGRAKATFIVTPGDDYDIRVGGVGIQDLNDDGLDDDVKTGGYNGGGAEAFSATRQLTAGGGGATDVRPAGGALADRILVAGGGGGAGGGYAEITSEHEYAAGGAGGDSGANGSNGSATALHLGGGYGRAGTETAGGLGGHSGDWPGATTPDPGVGQDGTFGQGGTASQNFFQSNGGGGGGGWYGGGGGGQSGGASCSSPCVSSYAGAGGGGGGSSHVDDSATNEETASGVRSGDGLATITYTTDPPPPTSATARVQVSTNPVSGTTFDYTLTGPNGLSEALDDVAAGSGYAAFSSALDTDGATYTITQTALSGFDLTGVSGDIGTVTARVSTSTASRTCSFTYNASTDVGDMFSCSFANRQRGSARVVSTVDGSALTGSESFSYQLRQGASAGSGGTILETLTANAGNSGTVTFAAQLLPGATYQLCEALQPAYTTSLGPPIFSVFAPAGDASVVCADFTTNAGQTLTFNIDNATVVADPAPTVTIDQATAQADPTSGASIQFTAVFSETPTDFTLSDVQLGGGTGAVATGYSVTGLTWTITVTGMTSSGTVTASIPAGSFTDSAGQANTASTSTDNSVAWVKPDTTAPTITCSATPALWTRPPNHTLLPISILVNAADGSGSVSVQLVSVTSSQADSGLGKDDIANDIQGWATGTEDLTGFVRAERYKVDRVYSWVYRATDGAGNTAQCTATTRITLGSKGK